MWMRMLMLMLERQRLRVWRLKRQGGSVRLELGLEMGLEMRLVRKSVVHHRHRLRCIADVTPASHLVGRKNQHAIIHAWIHLPTASRAQSRNLQQFLVPDQRTVLRQRPP
jgi:hypothetical protein